MQTISDNLRGMAKEIMPVLVDYMLNHSAIESRNKHDDAIVLINPHGDNVYRELDDNGRKLQSTLLKTYGRFYSILTSLLQGQSSDTLEKLSELHDIVKRTIEHEITWCKETREALNRAIAAIQDQLKLLGSIYEPSGGVPIYVPDTNALIYNTMLETWKFDEIRKFKILILPTVLSELDSLKVTHKNENVQKKAEKLIRQIKEYRRRGKLSEGVPILKEKIDLLALAVEPKMDNTLS